MAKMISNNKRFSLDTGHTLHVYYDGLAGSYDVWLNTEVADFDGVCIATGSTLAEAIASAKTALQLALAQLQAHFVSETDTRNEGGLPLSVETLTVSVEAGESKAD